MDQWFRYLRKAIFEDYSKITDADLELLLQSDKLNNFQKVSLKRTLTKGRQSTTMLFHKTSLVFQPTEENKSED